jgi:LmbE family N-acetylglucosaminyl deacetylase
MHVRFDRGLEVKRAMAIYAHPDDAEFGMAGTVAKWAKAGVEFIYCMLTNGASGSQDPTMTRARLRDVRLAEQREAARILGVKDVVFLDFEDGYLEPTIDVRRAVARQIRIHRPDVIFTMDPTMRYGGGYVNHPDHIAAAEVVMRSINPDASTRQMLPELWEKERLEPHKPKALFLMAFDDSATTIIDVSDVVEVKIKALLAHRSQLDEDSIDFIKRWMRDAGKKKGYRFAESFKVLRLDEDAGERDEARRRKPRGRATPRARRARPARGRRASRSTTPSRRGRPSRRGTSTG